MAGLHPALDATQVGVGRSPVAVCREQQRRLDEEEQQRHLDEEVAPVGDVEVAPFGPGVQRLGGRHRSLRVVGVQRPRMAGVGCLEGVHPQSADRVDGKCFQVFFAQREPP
ncbi:hypothetical protein ABZU94_02570 [Streptomyces mirabilis]|uniref:hypothetical protein n=1 Tax=Streptomyces sp. NPDC005388 TaxID=3156717 RepID=UPI0033AB9789